MSLIIKIPPEAFVIQHLFEDSKFFLEAAQESVGRDEKKTRRNIRASIISAFAALEALVNTSLYLLDEFQELDTAEKAFVQEKRIELMKEGYLELTGSQYRSLDDKISFLHWRRERAAFPKSEAIWKHFKDATELRNSLVHPRPGRISYSDLTVENANTCLVTAVKLSLMLGGPRIKLDENGL